jgi:pimeloyl-ACP methyl ester carboxylesterase
MDARYSIYKGLILCAVVLLGACKSQILEQQGPRDATYSTIGTSTNVVFIHGMYLTPDSWQHWERYFEAQGFNTHSPAWPLHDLSIEEQRNLHPSDTLAALSLDEVVEHYRTYISTLDEKPIVVGHSMGGLIAQLLLQEDLIAAGIAIHSGPPQGVISVEPAFLKANWPMLNPLISAAEPLLLTFKQFQYGFVNGMDLAEQEQAYADNIVPESRRVGRATTTRAAALNTELARGPLLLISGGRDRTITPSLNYANFSAYHDTPAITDYKQFPERNHWTIKQEGWENVADFIIQWVENNRAD